MASFKTEVVKDGVRFEISCDEYYQGFTITLPRYEQLTESEFEEHKVWYQGQLNKALTLLQENR